MLVFASPALFTTSSSPDATFASVTFDGQNVSWDFRVVWG